MVDFSVFDYLLDSVFIVDGDGKIVYCNEMAATFAQSSVKRLSGKVMFSDLMQFTEPGLLPFTEQSQGRLSPSPLIETAYTLPKISKTGKTQLTVRPVGDGQHWVFFLHDVSLEETLAAKYKAELQKTEEYARNLEKLVEARTAELNRANQTLQAILNSLGQGFFTFNAEGQCGDVYTKACADILEKLPKGQTAWDVLGIEPKDLDQFKKWMDGLFKELLPFEDMKALGPNLYPHSAQRRVTLDYYPIRKSDQSIGDVVVVATDKTAEYQAQLALEAERQFASMIIKFITNKTQFLQFLTSVRQSISDLMSMTLKPMHSDEVNEAFRVLHTLEGEAGTFSLGELRQLARDSQTILEPFKGEPKMPSDAQLEYTESLKTMSSRYERFISQNSEIIQIPKGNVSRSVEVSLESLIEFYSQLQRSGTAGTVLDRFQSQFLTVPIASCLRYFDSLVQSVAERLSKRVNPLVIDGGDLRIFPEPYQRLFSSMVHAFRNAVDHGLETPEEREWAGKPAAGTIHVSVSTEGNQIHMVVRDDGKGIDPAVIREKLKEKFPDKDFSTQSDEEVIQNVCMPGFSSRDQVGEFSGRGVGLDALREEVLKMGGSLHIKSKVGEGTAISISFPQVTYQTTNLRSA